MCVVEMRLYSGNRFCMYFVDLVAVSLVSWMFIIAVFLGNYLLSFVSLVRLC